MPQLPLHVHSQGYSFHVYARQILLCHNQQPKKNMRTKNTISNQKHHERTRTERKTKMTMS